MLRGLREVSTATTVLGEDISLPVLIGRYTHWEPAVGGEDGVRRVLELLWAELALDLMLCGLASPAEGDRSLLLQAGVVAGER